MISLVVALLAMGSASGRSVTLGRHGWVAIVTAIALTNLRYADPAAHGLEWWPFVIAIALSVAGAVAAWLPEQRVWPAVGITAILWCALLAVTWGPWGRASIDVFAVITGGTGQLLHGGNPYSPTFEYLQMVSTTQWGWVSGHFAYGPLVPVLVSPGWLMGDVRLMSAVAVAMTCVGLWWLARQGPQRQSAHRILVLALVVPFNLHMIDAAWVEVYVAAGIVWWLALRNGHQRLATLPLAVALLVSPLAIPLVLPAFIWSRRARFEIGIAICISCAVALPFVLMTGFGQLWYDVLGFQLALRPRYDGLNLTSYIWEIWRFPLPGWLPVAVALLAVLAVAMRGRPRSQGDLALQSALMLWIPLLVAKWAYFNYYYLCGMLLLAAGASWGTKVWAADADRPQFSFARSVMSKLAPQRAVG